MGNDHDVIAGCLTTMKAIKAHASSTLTIRHLEILFQIYLSSEITHQDLAKIHSTF